MPGCTLSQQFSGMVRGSETHRMSVSVVDKQQVRRANSFEVSVSHFTIDTKLNFSSSGKEAPLYADVKEGFSNLADGEKFTKEVKGDNRTRTYLVEGTRHGDEINVRIADITDAKNLLGAGFISDIDGLFDNSRFSIRNISSIGAAGVSLDPLRSVRLTVNYDDRFTGRRSSLTVTMAAGTTAEEAAKKVLDLLGIQYKMRTNEFGTWIELMDGSERFGGLQYYLNGSGGGRGIPFMRGPGGNLFFVGGGNIVFDRDASFSLVNEAATSNLAHPGTDFRYLGNLRVLYSELGSYTGRPPEGGFSFSSSLGRLGPGSIHSMQLHKVAGERFGFWYSSRFLNRVGALQAHQDSALLSPPLSIAAASSLQQPASPIATLQQAKKSAREHSGTVQVELIHAAEAAVQLVESQAVQAPHREKSSFAQSSSIQVESISLGSAASIPYSAIAAAALKAGAGEKNAALSISGENAVSVSVSNASALSVSFAQANSQARAAAFAQSQAQSSAQQISTRQAAAQQTAHAIQAQQAAAQQSQSESQATPTPAEKIETGVEHVASSQVENERRKVAAQQQDAEKLTAQNEGELIASGFEVSEVKVATEQKPAPSARQVIQGAKAERATKIEEKKPVKIKPKREAKYDKTPEEQKAIDSALAGIENIEENKDAREQQAALNQDSQSTQQTNPAPAQPEQQTPPASQQISQAASAAAVIIGKKRRREAKGRFSAQHGSASGNTSLPSPRRPSFSSTRQSSRTPRRAPEAQERESPREREALPQERQAALRQGRRQRRAAPQLSKPPKPQGAREQERAS